MNLWPTVPKKEVRHWRQLPGSLILPCAKLPVASMTSRRTSGSKNADLDPRLRGE